MDYSSDDIILLATSEAELHELVDGLYRPSQPQIQSTHQRRQEQGNGIACRILIQNELLEQVDTFPYLGSLITENGECTTELRTRLNKWQAIAASLQKIWKSHSIPISTKIRLMKALLWPVYYSNVGL